MKYLLATVIFASIFAGCSSPQCDCNCGRCKYCPNYDSNNVDPSRPMTQMTPWWKETK